MTGVLVSCLANGGDRKYMSFPKSRKLIHCCVLHMCLAECRYLEFVQKLLVVPYLS